MVDRLEPPETHREHQAQALREFALQEPVLPAAVARQLRQPVDLRPDRFHVEPAQELPDEPKVARLPLVDAVEQERGREPAYPLVKRRCRQQLQL